MSGRLHTSPRRIQIPSRAFFPPSLPPPPLMTTYVLAALRTGPLEGRCYVLPAGDAGGEELGGIGINEVVDAHHGGVLRPPEDIKLVVVA